MQEYVFDFAQWHATGKLPSLGNKAPKQFIAEKVDACQV